MLKAWASCLNYCAVFCSVGLLAACQMASDTAQSSISEQDAKCECETQALIEKPPIVIEPPVAICPKVQEPDTAKVKAAPKPEKQQNKQMARKPGMFKDKLLIGRVENVLLVSEDMVLKARIDTGAGLSSINGLDITDFERDGQRWIRFALLDPETQEKVYLERPVKRQQRIKQHGGRFQSRPLVSMSVKIGSIEEQVDMTVTDRTGYIYQVLVGRNFLRDRAIVDVSDRFVAKTKNH